MKWTLLTAFAALALLSEVSFAQDATNAAEIPVALPSPMPSPSRERPAANTDEGGLWGMSDRAEQDARHAGAREHDPTLSNYIRGVCCRVAPQHCGDVRLYVMNQPYFQASMAPNGYMEVWSGLLLRVEDEAQLAFVLGHEIGHYAENHSLQTWREARERVSRVSFFIVLTSGGLLGEMLYLDALSGVMDFSRELESRADQLGFDYAVGSGYDPGAGRQLWGNLIAETAASNNSSARRQAARSSVFSSHPLLSDRLEALGALAETHGGSGTTERLRYRAMIRPFLDPWLRTQLRRRDYGQTLHLLDRLSAHDEDLGVLDYYRGEVHRLRRGEGDHARAEQYYTAATAHPDAPAATWRELGEFAARSGRNAEAAALFTTYLERAPQAGDRALVEGRIRQLSGGGQ